MEKNILILTTTNEFLGKFERENVKILQRMGYQVHYAANMREPHYISDEERIRNMGVLPHHIEIARSPFVLRDNTKALWQLLALIKRCQIQVIHCHTPVGGVLGRLAGKLFRDWRLFIIYTAHGFHFYQGAPLFNRLAYYRAERKLARYTDILIVINREDYRNAERLRLKKGGRIYKIPGAGLDREIFHPLSSGERAAAREALGIGEHQFFLVSLGELNQNKNQKLILEALVKLREAGTDLSEIRYGICGDGFLRPQMEGWISKMGLGDTVTLYGHCRRIVPILGCADVTVFPSKREGLGMAGLESLAMGIPVIASDNRGTREYMEHGKNGYVYSPDDAEGFAEGIRRIRDLSPGEREKMAAYCQSCVPPFDKARANEVMQTIYEAADSRITEGREGRS